MKQSEAFEILKMGYSVFLTGPAGSGKTYLLNQYIKFLKENKIRVGITASTGIAATHLNGITIHSWAGIEIKDHLTSNDMQKISKRAYLKKHFKGTDILIIDEISMLNDFRLDMVDRVCRLMKAKDESFGGMQVVICGDFFQLPPISRSGEPAKFAYESKVWENMDLKVCYLAEQHRQSNDGLLDVLNDIRNNVLSHESLQPLRERYRKSIKNAYRPTKLYTHNADVDLMNNRELVKLDEKEERFEMESTGRDKLIEYLKRSCLAPETLKLKKNALVLFVKNNYEKGFVNGTRGVIVGFDDIGYPIVRTLEGKEIMAEPESWTVDDEDGKVLAEVKQVPLRLAWAITVHKSQGMSLDAVEMDLSKSFESGMGYVALSRVRTLGGLSVLGWNSTAGQINEDVFENDSNFKKSSIENVEWLKKTPNEEIYKKKKEFLGVKIKTSKKEIKIPTHEKTKALVDKNMSIKKVAEERGMTEETVLSHIEKCLELKLLTTKDLKHIKPKADRMGEIKKAFKDSEDTRLSPAKDKLDSTYSFKEIRIGRLFL